MLGVRADHSGHGSQQLTQEQDRSHKEGRHALLNLRSHFAGASDTPQTCFFLSCLVRSSNLIFLWNLQSFNYTKQLESPSSLRWFRKGWGGRRSSVLSLSPILKFLAHLLVESASAEALLMVCWLKIIKIGRYSSCPHNLHHFLQLLSHCHIQWGVKGQLSS